MLTEESRIPLPDAPADQAGNPVAAWLEPVTIDTYLPEEPDRYPAYLDSRVYQGSSGRVYPLPFHERVSPQKRPHQWQAAHLENEYVRLMILPELGGRIQFGIDKTNGYDFFYRNEVVKPALVGLAGPWIAGGVEFNWPQHHRPATFLPTSVHIEHEPDGAATVWCSDHDPFARMKGMHGVRLRPGSAVIEVRVRLYNRSELTQTFLWWANVAARTNADYQSFFPADVSVVADHAKRAITAFPAADRPYYGIDYPARRNLDRHPGSDLTVPGDRIDWYRNIPVPTSYMCLGSRGDFFGGYDHGRRAGFVHVADHHIAAGKKQWTWGNADFGHAWDRNLSDDGSSYVELMAGVYTDNQPDFSFLLPGETKAFSQFWYPIREIGPAVEATLDVAVSLERTGPDAVRLGVAASRVLEGAEVELRDAAGGIRWRQLADLAPDAPLVADIDLDAVGRVGEVGGALGRSTNAERSDGAVGLDVVVRHDGRELLRWREPEPASGDPVDVDAATEPPVPAEIDSVERLYLTGVHLWQYRHATRSPEPYWQEALRRDPGHVGANTALAAARYRSARYEDAVAHARAAVERLTERNPNPVDSEPFYLLGLAAERAGRIEEADDAYAKAAWNRAWRAPADYRRARLAAADGDDRSALELVDEVLAAEPEHLQAHALGAILLRRLGRDDEAGRRLDATLARDPLDAWTRHLAGLGCDPDPHVCLDVATEYRDVGERRAALDVLAVAYRQEPAPGQPAARPLIAYHAAEICAALGEREDAERWLTRATTVDETRCFPGRLDDADLLARRIATARSDARAHALLATWQYANDRRDDAIDHWTTAAGLADSPATERNLGLAAFNVSSDPDAARSHYDAALALAPGDPRLLVERDRLLARLGMPPAERLRMLAEHPDAVAQRDDLALASATLLLDLDRVAEARVVLEGRTFQPWEGGEGQILAAWERMSLRSAREAGDSGRFAEAVRILESAIAPPANLGEARHPLANDAVLRLALGGALALAGGEDAGRIQWEAAASFVGDFHGMATHPVSSMTYSSIVACRRLGDTARADALEADLAGYIETLRATTPTIDYFATSLPDLVLFVDDLVARRDKTVAFLTAQLALVRGESGEAASVLRELLQTDPGHSESIDLLRDLESTQSETKGAVYAVD